MKTSIYLKTVLFSTLAFISLVSLDSCKKDDTESTIEDVIQVAPVQTIKSEISNITNLSSLPAEVKTAATTITSVMTPAEVKTFANYDLTEVIKYYQTNITLSSSEVTKLKENDLYTYNEIVNRIAKSPTFTSSAKLSTYLTSMLNNAALKARLISDPGLITDLYAVNLYQGILDLTNYVSTYTIPLLQSINTLKTDALKSASTTLETKDFTLEEQQQIATLLLLALQNNQITVEVYLKALTYIHSGGTTN